MATDSTPKKYVGEDTLREAFKLIAQAINARPSITVKTNTSTEYVLTITNPDGSTFDTPNLKG